MGWLELVRTLLRSFTVVSIVSRGGVAQCGDSSIPFRETQLFTLKEDFAPFPAAYTNDRMFAEVKAVVARGGLRAGTLAERPSFCEEADGTNNWIISTG
jgi:hypothetical protein